LTRRTKLGWTILGLAVLALLAVLFAGEREAQRQLDRLRAEFQALPKLPSAVTVTCSEISRAGRALYGCRYRRNIDLPNVLAHYRGILQARGWTHETFNPISHTCSWSKAPDSLILEWSDGSTSASDWDLAVDLTWSAGG